MSTTRLLSSLPLIFFPPRLSIRRTFSLLASSAMEINGVTPLTKQVVPIDTSYEAAMKALSSLITTRRRGNGANRVAKYDFMFRYLKILGLEDDLAALKCIHVAGTKGKGSTCTFSEAILRECGFRTGLFTSPHLVDVRERFRINGSEISEDKFLHYFWNCWNQLKDEVDDELPMPPLFHFLTLLSFKIFLCEKVDVAVVEVGLGGRWDSTNVIKEPVVCGITSLGMDHMEILGDTIAKIASEKAGIFKPCTPAYTAPQLPEAMQVLEENASALNIPLQTAPPLDPAKLDGLRLGLTGDHQLINAGLAVALCRFWLEHSQHTELLSNGDMNMGLPEAFRRGLSTATLNGRAQVIYDQQNNPDVNSDGKSGDLIFYLDGAHSPESMEVCARWFCNVVGDYQHYLKDGVTEGNFHSQSEIGNYNEPDRILKKILLFNCMDVRDPTILLQELVSSCDSSGIRFSNALFVPSISAYNRVDSGSSIGASNTSVDLTWQRTLQRTWDRLIKGKGGDLNNGSCSNLENLQNIAANQLQSEDPSETFDPPLKDFVGSAVIPSLPLAIKWLRDCVKGNPSLQLQVLVTGSMHLVGDVLKLLRR